VTLVDGPNPISIKATDPQGNPFEVTRTVTKEKAKTGVGDTELTMSQALPWFLLIIILLAVVATILGYLAGRKARNKEEISRLDADRDSRERRPPPPPTNDGWDWQEQQPRPPEPETSFNEMPPEEDAAMAGGAMAAGAVAAAPEYPQEERPQEEAAPEEAPMDGPTAENTRTSLDELEAILKADLAAEGGGKSGDLEALGSEGEAAAEDAGDVATKERKTSRMRQKRK